MDYSKLITEIDGEIEKLQRAKDALANLNNLEPAKRAYHRSPKPVSQRRLTPAGRKRLSDMMKKRWADRKKKNKNTL